MPRGSKLGLKLSVESLCQRAQFNPTLELIRALQETDSDGKHLIRGKDRVAGCVALMNRIAVNAPVKAREVLADKDKVMKIIRNTFTLPETPEAQDANNSNPAA